MSAMFKLATDKLDKSYFTLDLDNRPYNVQAPNVTDLTPDICSFFDISLPVSLRRTTSFSNDLTTRDDVLLAFGALLLLLLIEGIVTTFLLRTKNGIVSNFGFSVKQVVELIREFNLNRIFKSRTYDREYRAQKRINIKLLVFALAILLSVFLLEVAVLFLTQPELREVTNNRVTFRIQQPVSPSWNAVRFHARASLNRPCSAIGLVGVDQGNTRINCCVTSTLRADEFELFNKSSVPATRFVIVSDLHKYGGEHIITIDDKQTAKYSSRAWFTLEDRRSRLMGHEKKSRYERAQIDIVHKQYIAFLVSAYIKQTGDEEAFTLKMLNDETQTKFTFSEEPGPVVEVIKIRGVEAAVNSTRYSTTVTGSLPGGVPALRVGQHHFRGSSAVIVTEEGDETDMFLEEGMETVRSVVWRESVRVMNWLSLLIILVMAVGVLVGLRFKLKPVAIAEIAGALVKEQVEADAWRSPVEVGVGEKRHFRVFEERGEAGREMRSLAEMEFEMGRGVNGETWSGRLSSI